MQRCITAHNHLLSFRFSPICFSINLCIDIDLLKIYVDEAKSGTNDNREQFLELIADSNKNKFNIVIVHKLDRFARNRYDSAFYKKKLKENGVKLLSVLERLDDSPESIILESVLEGMAEYYSKNLAREVMKGMKETALDCKHNGGIPPLGYDVDIHTKKYIINENEALAIRKIFELYLLGYGYSSISDELNCYGYKTKVGKPFTKNSIRDILFNEKYMGVYVFNKRAPGGKNHIYKEADQIIKIKGGIPAIVSEEIFIKAQKKLNSNSKGPRAVNIKEYYLLTGKVFCGNCNSAYTGGGYRGGRGGKKYYIYQCTGKKNNKCSNKDIRKDLIESFVIEQLKQNIFNDDSIEKLCSEIITYINKTQQNNKEDLTFLTQKKESLSNKINSAMDLLLEGLINKDTVYKKINDLQSELNICIDKIEQLKENDLNWVDGKKIKLFLIHSKNSLEDADNLVKRKVIETFVDKIIIQDSKISVTFKIDIYPTKKVESGKFGGGEGSRTPVRNHLHKNFYGCSLCFVQSHVSLAGQ